MRIIGHFSQTVIDLLKLDIVAGTPIYIGENNIEHMKKRHPFEFDAYFPCIEEIIQFPDYVGTDKKNGSIDFVKNYEIDGNYIQVSVRVSENGRYYARTLFSLMTYKADRYIAKGTLKKL